MDPARLQLHGDLRDLVRRRARDGVVEVAVPAPRSVKDAVESVGVPHTEVGAVVVDGTDVDWQAQLAGGETIGVHPVGEVPPGTGAGVGPPSPPRPLRFVADVHLGTLARRLRVLGIDTAWRNDAADDDLVACMLAEDRVLLTRDRTLLMRRVVVHGALVRHDDPDEQLTEVAGRFPLTEQAAPGTRCARCNGVVDRVPRDEVVAELEPGTRAADYDSFGRCRDCGRVYWSGAHADAIEAIIDRVR